MYLIEEPIISENESSNEIESLDLNDLVDKIISIPYGADNKLNEIELNALWEDIDTDNDGLINYEEFVKTKVQIKDRIKIFINLKEFLLKISKTYDLTFKLY